jgi:phage baseplate assembly protein W
MRKSVTRDAVGRVGRVAYGRDGHRRSYSSRTRRLLWMPTRRAIPLSTHWAQKVAMLFGPSS